MPQFQEYRNQVLKAYQEKKQLGLLSLNLKRPTPAHLRDECLEVLTSRYLKTDDSLLRDFFGNHENYAAAIRQIDIDKFKPLINYLDGKTKATEDKNIELLAWLIDFKERPFQFDYEGERTVAGSLSSAHPENIPLSINEFTPKVKKEVVANQKIQEPLNPLIRRKYLWSLMIIFLLLIATVGCFFWVKTHEQDKDCMYWTGNHFVSVDCSQHLPNIQTIALDTFELHQQFKVLHPESLDEAGIKKLWYSKVDKKIEFFNIGGTHPEHPEKQLKPITDYIIHKYILQSGKK